MLLGIDQGTSGTTALALDAGGQPVAQAYRPLASQHPQPGWVEQDPEALLAGLVEAVAEVLDATGGAGRVRAAGLANQGESVLAWDAQSGAALSPVLVWSDQRARPLVNALDAQGHGPAIARESGLTLSTYFSAPKLRWLLDRHPEVRAAARRGTLRLGTLDAWIGVRLGAPNVTDPSTASRTQLYSLAEGGWSTALTRLYGVQPDDLPRVVPSAAARGALTQRAWGGALPWFAGCVDQVAALLGCGCLEAGQVKVTYGTGAFVLAQAGRTRPAPVPGLLCSEGWSDRRGRRFVLDGGVFTAGTALAWLGRLGLLDDPARASDLARAAQGTVRFLPAFGGTGAPWWEPRARGVFAGLSDASGPAELVRAVLDGIAHSVADIVEAMGGALPTLDRLRADGGLSRLDYLLQRQADLTGLAVERAASPEATALGVALLAGVGARAVPWSGLAAQLPPQASFTPQLPEAARSQERAAWKSWRARAAALED